MLVPRSDIVRFEKKAGYWPNLEPPRTHSEHVMVKKWTDRNPLLRETANKVTARRYVHNCNLDGILADVTLIDCSLDTIMMYAKPPCVIKANNGSGRNLFAFTDEQMARLPRSFKIWQRPYLEDKGEWCYTGYPFKCIVEPMLWEIGEPHILYRWLCFHGVAHYVEAHEYTLELQRNGLVKPEHATHTMFKVPWTKQAVTIDNRPTRDVPKPQNHARMREIAEVLAKPFDFVRVDLYLHKGEIRFSELTHYPRSGQYHYDPFEFDAELGRLW
jgi:hypothetical protein